MTPDLVAGLAPPALDAVIYGRAALLWAATAYRLPVAIRGARDPALQAYSLSLLSFALAVTVLLPSVQALVDGLSGVPTLAAAAGNALAVVACGSIYRFLYRLNHPTASGYWRGQGALLLITLGLVAGLFVVGKMLGEDAFVSDSLGVAPFALRLVVLTYIGLALFDIARLAWRYAGHSGRPALALGLRLMTCGAVIGLVCVAHEVVQVGGRFFGLEYPAGMDRRAVREALITIAGVPWAIGITMPAWAPQLGIPALYRWCARYVAYRRLYPLWRALTETFPNIALDPPRSALIDALRVRDIGYLLCRRVIEIRDGRLELRPYLDPRVASGARAAAMHAGMPGTEVAALVEAACLRAALQARTAGTGLLASSPAAAASTVPAPAPGGADVDGEAAFLCRVAGHYAGSPALRDTLRMLFHNS